MLKAEEIKKFIEDDQSSTKKKLARIGQRYYEGDHDILQYRMFYYNADGKLVEDKTRANAKIPHPFFTELVDQLAAYMLSFKENPIRSDVEGLQDKLDEYFDDDFWAEIEDLIIGANAKGFEYLYAYKNEDDRLAFQCADSMGVVEVRAKDTDDNCEYVIYWYIDRMKGKKEIKRIQVWDKQNVTYWVQVGSGLPEMDDSEPINPKPHVVYIDEKGEKYGSSFGFIPFWRLDNCKKQFSGLKAIKALIDDYDLMECGLSNNLQDFDTPIHVVKGFEGDNLDELQQNLKTKKIVGVDDDGDVEIRTIDVPYQARKTKADEDEKNIYRFGMGFNSSQVGDGNITNIVIKSRYTLLDLKANKLEKRLKRLLKEIIRVVLKEINDKEGTDYELKDVYFKFTRSIMTNDTENIENEKVKAETKQVQVNTILNLLSQVPEEQARKDICDIMEWDYEKLKDKFPEDPEKDTDVALDNLKGAKVDE